MTRVDILKTTTSYPPYMYYEEVFDSAGGIAKGMLSFVSASPVPSEKMSNLTYTGILSIIL